MNFDEIKGLSVEELRKKELELKEGLFEAKMKNALGQLGNPLEIRGMRRGVARVKMALHSKTKQKS